MACNSCSGSSGATNFAETFEKQYIQNHCVTCVFLQLLKQKKPGISMNSRANKRLHNCRFSLEFIEPSNLFASKTKGNAGDAMILYGFHYISAKLRAPPQPEHEIHAQEPPAQWRWQGQLRCPARARLPGATLTPQEGRRKSRHNFRGTHRGGGHVWRSGRCLVGGFCLACCAPKLLLESQGPSLLWFAARHHDVFLAVRLR